MLIGKGMVNCRQKNKTVKCLNCEFAENCNHIMTLEEKIQKRKLEEEKRKCKCFKCIWANKEDFYCPFPHCIEER